MKVDNFNKRKRIEKNMKIMGFFWILEGIIGLAVLAYMMYKYFFS